jgi:hypothetical protein
MPLLKPSDFQKPKLETKKWQEGDWEYVKYRGVEVRIECLILRGKDKNFEWRMKSFYEQDAYGSGYTTAGLALKDAIGTINSSPKEYNADRPELYTVF